MSADPDSDLSALTALVVDANDFHRAIATDILRSAGTGSVLGASTAEEGLDCLRTTRVGVVLLDWMSGPAGGLNFVRAVRANADGPNRATPIVMLTARRRQRDVEAARAAGADAYLMKPVSGGAIVAKLAAVVIQPRPFMVTDSYVGPCRRRRSPDAPYNGPRRRLTDHAERRTDPAVDEDEVKAAIARARVAALTARAMQLEPGSADGARAVYVAALELRQVSEELDDSMLTFGAGQLVRYLEAVGATDKLDPEAVRTHVQALHQLAHLPNALADERRDVATSLRKMVDKKLKRMG